MKSGNMSIASDKKNKIISNIQNNNINKSSIVYNNKNNKSIRNMEDQWRGELDY